MPKISVIVPVYNVEEYLDVCLDTIIMQTFKDFEVICVDDGTQDSSGEILDKYALFDKRIKVIHQEIQVLKQQTANILCLWIPMIIFRP